MNRLIERVESHNYRDLFLKDLHWSAPTHRQPIALTTDEGETITATNVSSYRGVSVWVCDQQPGSTLEAQLDQLIAKKSVDRLIIFHDETEQTWRWPVRRSVGGSTTTRLSSHRHTTGQENPNFAHRLQSIQIDWKQPPDATGLIAQVREAFDVEAQNETRQASKLMARMYTSLEACGTPEHDISVSLARILFLMFGDDTDMWQAGLFQRFIARHTRPDASNLADRLNELFTWLDTTDRDRGEPPEHLRGFKYVNGGIFNEPISLPALKPEFRDAVLEACQRDWATVSPAIFGSMFQSVRDAKTRRDLGEHYTSEENILKTLNPLFLDELRADFELAKSKTNEKLALNRLRDRLGEIRFLDPACGCGNFIIIAYRELRELELQIMERLQEITGDHPLLLANLGLKVNLDNFYGIEIDEWPAKIAETAMFLTDRQADLKLIERLGWAPDRLPIQRQATIISGVSALRIDWKSILEPSDKVAIAGNPPFLGISLRSDEQKRELQDVWGGRYHGTLDYVTGWHAKCLDYFREFDGRWAFVTTNSITQGEAVAPLFEPILQEGWKIKFAHRSFRWTSEAAGQAAVHCVIIGFTKGRNKPRLFDYATPTSPPEEQSNVTNISPYLTDGPNILVTQSSKPLNPQMGEVIYGNKPTDGGNLVVEVEDVETVRSEKTAARFLRRYIGARELLHGGERYCLWLPEMQPEDERVSPVLRERLAGVRKFRSESKAASTREAASTPHLFRQISQPSTPYLCIPAHVSEARPYFLASRYSPDVITSNANFLTADDDGFVFAIISSLMFMTWQRTVGGRIKSDLRFNKLLTWNTFPLPHMSAATRAAIVLRGRYIVHAREQQPELSLAELYDPSRISNELLHAHHELDREVDRAFGINGENATELDRQRNLFSRYEKLSAAKK
ncbi:class I SAM-dependent DNA methyltransferase [Streptomyces galbus]|uniref:site-specific DNA-methyltransferase (adenine-specific) n=1 Tax=Streptomyces galbus TaxID=33898 RepID=A0ABX1IP96_STRGB|nr:class I SAM-dependent DNA methyltransferase [Streptomyces galbus]NKQ26078.1 class I SAM-dependent DNA methyltransferase [Streptomyces galbus]